MGNIQGQLSNEELDQLQESTNFSQEELKRLHRKFKKIDEDGSGTLTKEEFLKLPNIEGNPLLERVLDVFDKNRDGEIQFTEFISSLAVFNQKDDDESKLRFAFEIYDIDRDGFISNGELFLVLQKMVGNNLDKVQLQQIVDKTIIKADLDGDGKISYEEFKQMIGDHEGIGKKLTIDLSDFQDNNNNEDEVEEEEEEEE
eukprot:TRINITY_DN2103_c4_g1_i1.p1 TRINITY_DN2103_c4_g1~~TRINITY_DN2103_c4_g1_i1.p1  ORF type:complete len:200 (-),score=95.96 TRINITY_DN2103_c4_g1_i1:217-816(-)